MLIRNGMKVKSAEYLRYAICKEMGWDFYTYEAQPPFFLETIFLFMIQENEKAAGSTVEPENPMKGKGYSRHG